MKNIQVEVLNPESLKQADDMMVFSARLTQRGEKINTMEEAEKLSCRPYAPKLLRRFNKLPHPTIQKFTVINVLVVGASRRFLAQITRHQNEVKFMSASMQYSDYSDVANFCEPYGLKDKDSYYEACENAMCEYNKIAAYDNDAAGYIMPHSLRNVLLISATPYQWKHMIQQRICRRNTDEMRIVMLKIWDELYKESPVTFSPEFVLPPCSAYNCPEGQMSCGCSIIGGCEPLDLLRFDYPKLFEEE